MKLLVYIIVCLQSFSLATSEMEGIFNLASLCLSGWTMLCLTQRILNELNEWISTSTLTGT